MQTPAKRINEATTTLRAMGLHGIADGVDRAFDDITAIIARVVSGYIAENMSLRAQLKASGREK